VSRETSRGTCTVRLLCEAFHVSRQAYYAARRGPSEEKPERQRRKKPRPGWATTEQILRRARQIVASHPGWGVRKVWALLRREGIKASRKRVWAVMRAAGLVMQPPSLRDPLAPRGQVVVADSNRRWASDLTTTWTREDGLVAIIPVVDCGDRVLLACGVTCCQDSPSVLAPIAESMRATFERPENVPDGLELRTDHGPQYTGADCEDLVRRWNLVHTFAPVGRPTGNAVAERLIQTIKVELLWTRDWKTADEVREAIEVWRQSYNHVRPHQALGWQTPVERRSRNLAVASATAA